MAEKALLSSIFGKLTQKTFVRELQASHRETNIQAVRPPDSCCTTLVAGDPGDMHGLPLLQTRLAGIAKEAGMLLFSKTNPICMLNF